MTPATCGSRYRGPHHTYACKRAPGHDGGHADQYPSGAVLATWTDTMAMPVADIADQASANLSAAFAAFCAEQATPGPLRDDDQRQQHRRTLQYVLDRLDRGDRLGGYEVAELRRVTAAEQTENDHARTAAAEWERLYHLTQDRLSEQIRSTQKARRQRSEAREHARTAERRAEHAEAELKAAEAFRDAVYEELCIKDSTPPDAAIGAIRGRAINVGEQAERAEKAIKRATEEYDRAEAAEARAAMAEATADLRTQRVEQLERSRDYWKERAAELDADRDRLATAARAVLNICGNHGSDVQGILRAALNSEQSAADHTCPDGEPCPDHDQPAAEFEPVAHTAGREPGGKRHIIHNGTRAACTKCQQPTPAAPDLTTPAEACWSCGSPKVAYHNYREQPFCWPCADGQTPDLTTPVSPREKTPARNDHPLWDLLHALTKPEPVSNDDAMTLVRAYYDAITSAPPAYDADREAYATEQVQRAVRHLAGSTTNTDLWARIGMTLGWTPEHARDVARHRRLAGEADLSVKLTAAREQIKALIDARDRDRATLDTIRAALDTTEANG